MSKFKRYLKLGVVVPGEMKGVEQQWYVIQCDAQEHQTQDECKERVSRRANEEDPLCQVFK